MHLLIIKVTIVSPVASAGQYSISLLQIIGVVVVAAALGRESQMTNVLQSFVLWRAKALDFFLAILVESKENFVIEKRDICVIACARRERPVLEV